MTCVMWNLASFCLERGLVSVQDRCMVCARHILASEIILDAPDGTLGDDAQVKAFLHLEIVLILTHDRCTVCVERTIG